MYNEGHGYEIMKVNNERKLTWFMSWLQFVEGGALVESVKIALIFNRAHLDK